MVSAWVWVLVLTVPWLFRATLLSVAVLFPVPGKAPTLVQLTAALDKTGPRSPKARCHISRARAHWALTGGANDVLVYSAPLPAGPTL